MAAAFALALLAFAAAPALATAPANDDFDGALVLEGEDPTVEGTTAGATAEIGEPNHRAESSGHSVWYRWAPPRSGTIEISCTSAYQPLVAVYRGAALAALEHAGGRPGLPGCDKGFHEFRARAGVEYRIAVDSALGEGGEFRLEMRVESEVPANDLFAAPAPVQYLGGNAAIQGSTQGAAREPGEPAHSGSPFGSSVWFTWTAGRSGPTRIFPCHGSFHPAIAVYSGASLGALARLDSPAVGESPVGLCALGGSGVVFGAVAGQPYSIAVDGYDGEWGAFELELLEAPLPQVRPGPPETMIRPKVKVEADTAKILFTARRGREARFECRLDGGSFKPCYSPKVYKGLRAGRHRFAVVAIASDEYGERDPTPAVRRFRVPAAKGKQ